MTLEISSARLLQTETEKKTGHISLHPHSGQGADIHLSDRHLHRSRMFGGRDPNSAIIPVRHRMAYEQDHIPRDARSRSGKHPGIERHQRQSRLGHCHCSCPFPDQTPGNVADNETRPRLTFEDIFNGCSVEFRACHPPPTLCTG